MKRDLQFDVADVYKTRAAQNYHYSIPNNKHQIFRSFKHLHLIIVLLFCMGFTNAKAAGGIYDGWLIFNGSTFNLGSQPIALNGHNFGSFASGASANISYTEADMYKDGSGNNCSAELWYQITGTGSTSYSGTAMNTGNMGYNNSLGGNNYKWSLSSISNANILAGLSVGTYKIAFWIHGTGSNSSSSSCSDNFYLNNSGNNYVATFSIVNTSATDYFRSKITGDWNMSSNWESSPNNSSWGTSTLVPGSTALGITILNGHNITLNADVTVPSLTINTGGTFTASDASSRTLTITKSAAGSSTTLTNNGTWANGTGGSTVIFTGSPSSGNAIHTISGTIPLQNITANKTGGSNDVGVSFGANSSVSGTLEIGAGGFVSTAPPASFYGETAILKFNQGTGAIYNVNSGDYSWSTTVVPNYITISSGTVNLNAERTATGNLLLDGGNLSIVAALTVDGTIINSTGISGLVVKSGGSLIQNSAVSATVERYLTKYNDIGDKMYHLLSSPVAAQSIQTEFVATIPTAGHDFYAYNELTNMWINSKASDGSWNDNFDDYFVIGKGYLVAYPSDFFKSFSGTLNTAPQTLTCTNSPGKGEGWNLLGNPFQSAINWDDVNLGDGMDNALYYYDNTQQNYRYYIKFPGDTITLTGQKYIPAMQGFMVHANTGSNKTITITSSALTHNGQNVFYKSSNSAPNSLSLKVSANGYQDEAFIHFNLGATTAFDGGYDAYKLKSISEKVPALYTVASDGSELAINGLPETASKSPIPVYFKTSLDGKYLFSANLQNVTYDIVYLTDNKLNHIQDLTLNPDYNFVYSTSDEPNRFTLSFGTLGIDKPNQSQIRVYSASGKINISGVDGKAEILVRNMMGQVVMRNSINGSTLQSLNTRNLPAGVYVVSVVSGKQTVSEKVVVK